MDRTTFPRQIIAIVALTCATAAHVTAAPPAVPDVFDIPQLNGITIDGRADDWGAQGFRIVILTPINAPLRPSATFDAKARLGWDEHGLLVLVQVTDDQPLEARDEDHLADRDSVEISLATGKGAKDSYGIVISPGLDLVHPQLRSHFNDHRQDKELQQVHAPVVAARTKTATGYILEARLPWENLGIKPVLGHEVALQLGVNDWDSDESRFQARWYPSGAGLDDTSNMQRLRLAQLPGAPVQAVATGAYERFRRTRLRIAATGEYAGKPVEVREGKTRLGKGVMSADVHQEYGGKARAEFVLPMPARGSAYGPLSVLVNNRPVAVITLDDPNPARREAFNRAPMVFHPFVFTGTKFPSCDFAEPNYIEDLVGTYTLSTTFYDAAQNPVKSAAKPGRHGAIVDITTEDGKHSKRFYTLFRQPEETNWRRTKMPVTVVFPPELGIDPIVTEEQTTAVSEAFRRQWTRASDRDEDNAVLLAGLYETQPGAPRVARTDVWHRNEHWWYQLKQKTGDQQPLRYLLYVPPGYNDDATKKWPLILFLHGSGERGDDLAKVKVHGPPKLVAAGKQFPFIIVSPQCPDGDRWHPEQLNDLLNGIIGQYRVDTDRLYLTGLSMGGFGTWDMAMAYPDKFAAIAPIAAIGDPTDVERIKTLPVWAFHGTKDPTVPIEEGQKVVDALKQIGGDVKFTTYPGVGHDSWTATYDNPELYDWFLAHRRGDAIQEPRASATGP